jgi:Rab guanine nucleotide exchange factor SEC2
MYTLGAHHAYLLSSPRHENTHDRSSSLGPARPNPTTKAIPTVKSSNALAEMAASQPEPVLRGLKPRNGSEESLNTLPDPRNGSTSDLSPTRSLSPRHPELSEEVSKLSEKLINAINHQTSLEDTLAQVRHELETSRARIQKLEAEARAEQENEKHRLMADLDGERKQKGVILQEKRGIENELENLTTSLFEEANKMVASANKERDAVERRNQQLRDQVKDTELLLANHQEQLTQLKVVMQQMSSENTKEEQPESARSSAAASSPSSYKEKDANVLRLLEAMNLSPRSMGTGDDISPAPSTTLTHLLKPVCRTDLPAYEEFQHLLFLSQKSQPPSRVTSGSYGGLSVMGLGGLTSSSASSALQAPNNSSSASLNATSTQSATTSPQLPGSFSPNQNADKGPIPLKEMKFYKRLLTEDIEPTLRLDLSPHISWLARRSILSALTENGLIVVPLSEQSFRLWGRSTPCALCSEARKDNSNPRTHHMRVREGEGATKWALCTLCLEKVRATCDLVAYVRMVRDGVVRCADKEEEEEAWEELIRLRERLFWARMAGGVVPSFVERMSEKGSPMVSSSREASQGVDFMPAKMKQSPSQTPTNRPSTPTPTSSNASPDTDNGEASAQLQRNLSDSITTTSTLSNPSNSDLVADADPSSSIPGIKDVTPKTPPRFPSTSTNSVNRDKRGGSWGNLKVNVPRAWASLRDDVNVLH